MPVEEGWFLLTTFPKLSDAVQTYATRFQLEEMFRDYKMYGFNLELNQLNGSRFDAWFLLLTLVYSAITFTGICVTEADNKYLVRTDNTKRSSSRYSIVSLGKVALFYNFDWGFITTLISQYIRINRHKIDCYVRGLDFSARYLVRV
jgi:hypothetical protein